MNFPKDHVHKNGLGTVSFFAFEQAPLVWRITIEKMDEPFGTLELLKGDVGFHARLTEGVHVFDYELEHAEAPIAMLDALSRIIGAQAPDALVTFSNLERM